VSAVGSAPGGLCRPGFHLRVLERGSCGPGMRSRRVADHPAAREDFSNAFAACFGIATSRTTTPPASRLIEIHQRWM
jgi:hypothetical protein